MAEKKSTAEATVKNIRRNTRKKYSPEEKIRIVTEGLRGDLTLAALCRREGINQNSYYKWSKELLEAGEHRLVGDTHRQATSEEVKGLRKELDQLTCACGTVQASCWWRSCPFGIHPES